MDNNETNWMPAENMSEAAAFAEGFEPAENTKTSTGEDFETEAGAEVFTLKHLGEEKQVSKEELIRLGQKGIDYDRIRSRYELLKEGREAKLIDSLAKEAGLGREAYLMGLEKAARERQVQRKAESLGAEGYEMRAALEIAKLSEENEQMKKEVKREERDLERKTLRRDLKQLLDLYPEAKNLPKEVAEAIVKRNVSPTAAYQDHLIRKQREQLRMYENDRKNREKALGSPLGQGSRRQDSFLSGFLGGF